MPLTARHSGKTLSTVEFKPLFFAAGHRYLGVNTLFPLITQPVNLILFPHFKPLTGCAPLPEKFL
jgi:hypothetical protein